MHPDTATTPTYTRERFCSALKAVRERKGITLAEITATTKIPAFLIEGLERNDLRRWPGGLFRRSFFRDYARAIGLPVAEASAEFVKFFPDDDDEDLAKIAAASEAANHAPASILESFKAAIRRGVATISQAFAKNHATTDEPGDDPPAHAWVTDARRVGPAPPARVRIKVPR